MKDRLHVWRGWGSLALCLLLFGAMWALYAVIGPVPAELALHARERWLAFAPMLAFPPVGALILAHQPGHRAGLVFAIVGF